MRWLSSLFSGKQTVAHQACNKLRDHADKMRLQQVGLATASCHCPDLTYLSNLWLMILFTPQGLDVVRTVSLATVGPPGNGPRGSQVATWLKGYVALER